MEYSRFFNGTAEDRRRYNASDFAGYFESGYSDGVYRKSGLITLRCTNTGLDMNTKISIGAALIKGYQYLIKDTPLILTHDTAHATYNRIDRIVLRLDLNDSARNIKAFILKGMPGENPIAPSLTRNSLIYEISLAQVLIPANSSTIPIVNITDERMNRSVCGVVTSQVDAEYLNLEDYTMEVTAFDEFNDPLEVCYFNRDGILLEKSVLADKDENGKYTTLYIHRYLEDGVIIGDTREWKLTYNENGFVVKKQLVVM